MSVEDFIIWVFCWVDDSIPKVLSGQKVRSKGFPPAVSDSEIITMEIVGEFLCIDTDKGIWQYFSQHWKAMFPALSSRSNFAKHASNLWAVKQFLQNHLIAEMGSKHERIHIIDGFPIPVCHFRRAPRCKKFSEEADYGHCASKKETYYGLQGHLVISESGAITGFTVTAASAGERESSFEIVGNIEGFMLGDKGYLGEHYSAELFLEENISLSTPVKKNMEDKEAPEFRKYLNDTRRRIETVIGQLTERFSISKVWARDTWHLTNRMARKVLGHTLGIFLLTNMGIDSMELDCILSTNS